ncbi:hypothetical protein PENFLA_c011G03756 [Penicillium flavigenum]|uniref:Uncharacterized protein n=1 Tax=Penicillium flavigenum TaxID=254877 RepID=A0A1V6TAM3_9EURO|nr:hypothetical protein PENFLA_c011G03756 [Penicillium flavigenum]
MTALGAKNGCLPPSNFRERVAVLTTAVSSRVSSAVGSMSMAKVKKWSYSSLSSSIQTHTQSSSAGDRFSCTARASSSQRTELGIVAREMSRRSVAPSHRFSFYSPLYCSK